MLDASPRALVQAPPLYPHEAKIRGFEGEVLVAFTVDESGHVISVQVLGSSDPIFEKAARLAVGKWRFEPGRRQGRVVRFAMTVPIVFHLNQ
ncbi:MAG: energy transducer TonB [Cephaloticoccus sp.]|nr:energy transducer TonB [Cephaloticoccus sp.]